MTVRPKQGVFVVWGISQPSKGFCNPNPFSHMAFINPVCHGVRAVISNTIWLLDDVSVSHGWLRGLILSAFKYNFVLLTTL